MVEDQHVFDQQRTLDQTFENIPTAYRVKIEFGMGDYSTRKEVQVVVAGLLRDCYHDPEEKMIMQCIPYQSTFAHTICLPPDCRVRSLVRVIGS